MPTVTQAQLEKVFDDADWPMAKDDVVAYAERATSDEQVIRAVRALPLGEYERLQDVLTGIDTPDTPG